MSDPNRPFAPPDAATALPLAPPIHGYTAEPRKRRWLPWLIAGVVLVVVVALVGAGAAIIAGMSSLASNIVPAETQLVAGETGFPTSTPLECADPCFTTSDIEATVFSDSELDYFGLTKHDFPWGTYDPTTADELFRSMVASWKGNDGAPNSCVFALGNSPSVVDLVSDEGVTDEIQFTGEHASGDVTTTLDQSVRVFPDTESAAAYMSVLYDQIEGCPEISIGSPSERYTAQITGAPALSLPDDVAGVGWVRTGDPGPRWRAYVVDIQRGNLVVRTRMLTDGSVSELEFRALVELYALQFAAIEPTPPAG